MRSDGIFLSALAGCCSWGSLSWSSSGPWRRQERIRSLVSYVTATRKWGLTKEWKEFT